MKVKEIGIKSLGEGFQEFKTAFAAAKQRHPFKTKKGAYFTSLAAARNFLTPKRLELLRTIKIKAPNSIYELARLSHRSFPSIARDVGVLSKHGLIQLSKRPKAPRKNIQLRVPYDAINLWIGI